VIFMPIDAPNVLCAQLTRDLFAIVEFSFNSFVTIRYFIRGYFNGYGVRSIQLYLKSQSLLITCFPGTKKSYSSLSTWKGLFSVQL